MMTNDTNKQTAIYFALALVLGSTQVQAQTGNTKYGTGALFSNTTGSYNSAFGLDALRYNTTGYYNTASGNYSLFVNTTGGQNTASGANSLRLQHHRLQQHSQWL